MKLLYSFYHFKLKVFQQSVTKRERQHPLTSLVLPPRLFGNSHCPLLYYAIFHKICQYRFSLKKQLFPIFLPQLGQLIDQFLGLVPAKARIGDGLSIAVFFHLLIAIL